MNDMWKSIALIVGVASLMLLHNLVGAAPADIINNNIQASTCRREIENANRTLSQWAETMEAMVNESRLPISIREAIHNEANRILDLIEEFGEEIKTKQPTELARDLVSIRRRSNRMALDIYLNTFDMRWPQTSLSLGVTIERVQQACLDRETIQTLETPTNPLQPLT